MASGHRCVHTVYRVAPVAVDSIGSGGGGQSGRQYQAKHMGGSTVWSKSFRAQEGGLLP